MFERAQVAEQARALASRRDEERKVKAAAAAIETAGRHRAMQETMAEVARPLVRPATTQELAELKRQWGFERKGRQR